MGQLQVYGEACQKGLLWVVAKPKDLTPTPLVVA
jgi:hypothetical protein